jgi:hypothetical protein
MSSASRSSGQYSEPFQELNISSKVFEKEFGRGELQPAKFYGITISKMGDSRNSPFKKLKVVALSQKIPIEDRMRAVRYMDRIPHIHKLEGCLEAARKIIDYDECPIGERYWWFSNNEKITKLSGDLVRACHHYFFTLGLERSHWPLIFRLLSASQIYTTELHHLPIWTQAREFILKLALDKDESVRIRGEAADILSRQVVLEDALIGREILNQLGELYAEQKFSNVYNNAQNVHNEAINESVMGVIRHLLQEKGRRAYREQNMDEKTKKEQAEISSFTASATKQSGIEQNTGDIHERLLILTKDMESSRKGKIFSAFNFALVHPVKYEGVTASDLMVLIWNKIQSQTSELRAELEKRFTEELHDMIATDGACSTGIVSRLVNVLQGYVQDEGLQIKMSIKDQVRANAFARLQSNLKFLPDANQEEILTELTEDGPNKPYTKEFIKNYGVKEELEKEFVEAGLVDAKTFTEIYRRVLADFAGVNDDQLDQFLSDSSSSSPGKKISK